MIVWRAWLHPWTQSVPAGWYIVLPVQSTPACIYNAYNVWRAVTAAIFMQIGEFSKSLSEWKRPGLIHSASTLTISVFLITPCLFLKVNMHAFSGGNEQKMCKCILRHAEKCAWKLNGDALAIILEMPKEYWKPSWQHWKGTRDTLGKDSNDTGTPLDAYPTMFPDVFH
jgi:hypothetical protein